VKISKKEQQRIQEEVERTLARSKTGNQTLNVLGIGPSNDVLFTYTNLCQNLQQTFGVNLKYYKGHV